MEQAAGLLRGDTPAQMAANVGAVFMPHGLGHLIGLDTHDVGGYPSGTVRDSRPGYKSLRCGRVLQENMVSSSSSSNDSSTSTVCSTDWYY
jgi:Xaa-Pro dipeptidase